MAEDRFVGLLEPDAQRCRANSVQAPVNLHEPALVDADEEFHVTEQRPQRALLVFKLPEGMESKAMALEHLSHRTGPFVRPVDGREPLANAHDARGVPGEGPSGHREAKRKQHGLRESAGNVHRSDPTVRTR